MTGTILIGETITTESWFVLLEFTPGSGELGGLPSLDWGGEIGGVSNKNCKTIKLFNLLYNLQITSPMKSGKLKLIEIKLVAYSSQGNQFN